MSAPKHNGKRPRRVATVWACEQPPETPPTKQTHFYEGCRECVLALGGAVASGFGEKRGSARGRREPLSDWYERMRHHHALPSLERP